MHEIAMQDIRTNGVTLRCAVAGPEDGPLVLLLHGFPELWYTWRRLVGPLAEAGFRVVAPDQRGYAGSDKPAGVAPYTKDVLVADVVGLIDHFGRAKAHVVGHDWGGVVAWWLADQHAERVDRLVVLNMPHHSVMAKHLTTPKQLRRSWYVFAFQLPWLPERLLRRNRFAALRKAMVAASKLGAYSDADVDRYVEAWSADGALRGMLAWYRAAARVGGAKPKRRTIAAPTLLIWGVQDFALGAEMAQPSIDRCDDGRLELVEDAGHFVQHDAPDRVEAWVLEHLSGDSRSA